MNNFAPNENIESSLNDAIHSNDLSLVKKCLLSGEIKLTSEFIHNFIPDIEMISFLDNCLKLDSLKYKQYKDNKELIFEILLKHGFILIVNDIPFMKKLISSGNTYYIDLLIRHGYNGTYPGSIEIFKKIINTGRLSYQSKSDSNKLLSAIRSLLDNGFNKHIQSVLMYCIIHGNVIYLQLLLDYGANFYSILHDVHHYAFELDNIFKIKDHYPLLRPLILDNINFFLDNSYKIEMLGQPIFKFFLIKSIPWRWRYVVPLDICVHILRLYMETDYVIITDTRNNTRKISDVVMTHYNQDREFHICKAKIR